MKRQHEGGAFVLWQRSIETEIIAQFRRKVLFWSPKKLENENANDYHFF